MGKWRAGADEVLVCPDNRTKLLARYVGSLGIAYVINLKC